MAIEIIDIGNQVICDWCGTDCTQSDEIGGLLFGSKACCPACVRKVEQAADHYGEQRFIKDRCPPGMMFREWVLKLRDGDNTVRIITGDDIGTIL